MSYRQALDSYQKDFEKESRLTFAKCNLGAKEEKNRFFALMNSFQYVPPPWVKVTDKTVAFLRSL